MSMSRLWRYRGKRDKARELLAPVYGWFTEGFDTLDLKEAKALLDSLDIREKVMRNATSRQRANVRRTEGFETRDLKEARALLEELAS